MAGVNLESDTHWKQMQTFAAFYLNMYVMEGSICIATRHAVYTVIHDIKVEYKQLGFIL